MKRARSDWEDLRCFAAIARCGGLSPAARALGVAHTTVARRLTRLEAALGRRLFDRLADGYALTDDGKAALAQVAAMEAAAHQLTAAPLAADAAAAVKGLVRLTATRALTDCWLAPKLGELAERHPAIDLVLLPDARALSLSRREADLALRLAEPADGDFIARRMCVLRYGLYAAPAWIKRREDGGAPTFVGFEDRSLPESAWLSRAAPGGRAALRVDSVLAQRAACLGGVGAALLPRYLARGVVGLKEVASQTPPPERRVWLLIRRERRQDAAVRVVADFLADAFIRDRGLFEDP